MTISLHHHDERSTVDDGDIPVLNGRIAGNDRCSLTNAVVGRLVPGRRLVDTVAFLAANGIEASRIHVLRGPEGEVFLRRLGNWFTRLFADDHAQYLDLLRNGSTLVAVLDVADDALDETAVQLRHAGVHILRRYGSWTFTDG